MGKLEHKTSVRQFPNIIAAAKFGIKFGKGQK